MTARLARHADGEAVLAALRGFGTSKLRAIFAKADTELIAATGALLARPIAGEAQAVAFVAALPRNAASLALSEAAIAGWPHSGAVKRERLRLFEAIGDQRAMRDYAAELLGRPLDNAALAFAIWATLDGAHDPLTGRAADALIKRSAADGPGGYWLARYHEVRGEIDEALAAHLAVEAVATSVEARRNALREAAALALRKDRYGSEAPLIARALTAAAAPDPDWRVAAWQAIGAGRGATFDDPPLVAFSWLVRDILPQVTRYTPENNALLIGNTLAAGGMERILVNTTAGLKAANTFDTLHLMLMRFDVEGPSGFFFAESGLGRDEVAVMDSRAISSPVIGALPNSWVPRAQAIHERVLATRPRVVHAWNDLTGLIAAYAALAAGAPRVIVHIHHMRVSGLVSGRAIDQYPACYRLLLERPEVELMFCSDAAAHDYARWWGVPFSPRFRTLRNGIAAKPLAVSRKVARAELDIPADGAIVGAAFRFDEVKQPLVWIETARHILDTRPDTRFVLAGDGVMFAATRARIGELGLADRFVLPGKVRDVERWIAAMDVFLVTSAMEGLGNGAIEAQLAGVPVVAFDVGGLGETILAGETGWLVPAGDVDALVGATIALLDDPVRRAELAPVAVARALARFGIARYMRELIAIYGPPKRP